MASWATLPWVVPLLPLQRLSVPLSSQEPHHQGAPDPPLRGEGGRQRREGMREERSGGGGGGGGGGRIWQ